MLRRRFLIGFLCSLLALPAMSAPYENTDISIDLPAGFSGPLVRKQNEQRYTLIFSKSYPDDPTKTVLQVTVTKLDKKPATMGDEDLIKVANRHLAENMADMSRHRDSFMAAPPERLKISGLPAARGTWTGKLQGKEVTGTLYTVLSGQNLFLLQTQDLKRVPAEGLQQAALAIETIRLKRNP
ncbi:hypothetical protein [Chitinimonas naiadis]